MTAGPGPTGRVDFTPKGPGIVPSSFAREVILLSFATSISVARRPYASSQFSRVVETEFTPESVTGHDGRRQIQPLRFRHRCTTDWNCPLMALSGRANRADALPL